ncbi:MAG: hypothetical protein ABIH00_04340 [Armatimonadota bacterium]
MKTKIITVLFILMTAFLISPLCADRDWDVAMDGAMKFLNDPPPCRVSFRINMYNDEKDVIDAVTYFNRETLYRTEGKIYSRGRVYKINELSSEMKKLNYFSIEPQRKYPSLRVNGMESSTNITDMAPYPVAGLMEKFQPANKSKSEKVARQSVRKTTYNGIPSLYGEFDSRYGKACGWVNMENSCPLELRFPLPGGQNFVTIQYLDYKEVPPRMVPFRCRGYINKTLCWEASISNIEMNVDMPLDIFNPKLFNKKSLNKMLEEHAALEKMRAEYMAKKGVKPEASLSPGQTGQVQPVSTPMPSPGRVSAQKEVPGVKKTHGNILWKIIFIIIFMIGVSAIVYYYLKRKKE